MLGLGLPQLILILAGICFLAAGIYGLFPSLVTVAGAPASRLSRLPLNWKDRQRGRAGGMEQLTPVLKLGEPALKPATGGAMAAGQPSAAPVIPTVEPSPAVPDMTAAAPSPTSSAPEKPAPVLTDAPVTPVIAAAPNAAIPAEASKDDPNVDQELVEELFAEMFSLRATVADLVGEVHQLRSEHRPRRFVIEEV